MFEAFVYEWTDSSNGKKYIGVHKGSIDDGYIGSGKHFKAAYKKRPNCFNRAIIGLGTVKSMRQFESQLLKEYDVKNNASYYNMADNEMPYTGGICYSEGRRERMSAVRKGKTPTDEHRKKISDAKKGKPPHNKGNIGKLHTEESKRKMSAAKIGKTVDDSTRQNMRIAKIGKTHSESTRQKLTDILKGNTRNKGNSLSEETKRKISNSLKKRNLTIVNKTEQGRIPELRETEE